MSSEDLRLSLSRETLHDLQPGEETTVAVRGGGNSVLNDVQICEALYEEVDRRRTGTTEPLANLTNQLPQVEVTQVPVYQAIQPTDQTAATSVRSLSLTLDEATGEEYCEDGHSHSGHDDKCKHKP